MRDSIPVLSDLGSDGGPLPASQDPGDESPPAPLGGSATSAPKAGNDFCELSLRRKLRGELMHGLWAKDQTQIILYITP
eukprot:CAMPEP_0173426820 /NCGR_PEP_ID=MMETSP1357-20121228/6186_1 /TAXON_ID=77926 /ORGANISM="Hemiselmis rufescens, Strain PCC563" /LENGTH=78 /DNA_ID=CAMNT_0014390543 /DNA_START=376 /DNA_END=612 /DNA_ORIENTATION=+